MREWYYCPWLNCYGTVVDMKDLYYMGGMECPRNDLCSCKRVHGETEATDGR